MNAIMKNKDMNFYDSIKNVQKILFLDLGFLGDTIHKIPALYCIRQAFPDAEIHGMVGEHIMSIMDVVPWVDKVIGYPRFPKGPVWYKDIMRVIKLRKERYDVIINLNGSDRSSLLSWAIGAPFRLGRIPPKVPAFWRLCFTNTVFVSANTTPVYKQAWDCLKKVGFPGEKPEFNITVPETVLEKIDDLIEHERDFIHISPFTTQDLKELPIPILADFINSISRIYPHLKIVLSCAPNERERSRFKTLLQLLDVQPWKVFPGTLNLVELAALISRSAMHLGGDSGAIHIAFMTGISTISWFRNYLQNVEWLPYGPEHQALIGEASPLGLTNITSDDLVGAFEKAYRHSV